MIVYKEGRPKTVRTLDEELDFMTANWHALTPQQQALIEQLLDQEGDYSQLMSSILDAHYVREPVDIDTFLADEYYSGPGGSSIYDVLKDELRTIFTGKYNEVIMTGCVDINAPVLLDNGSISSVSRLLEENGKPMVSIAGASPRRSYPKHSGVQSVVEVELTNGMVLKLTHDHQVQCGSEDGLVWIEAGKLSEGDFVASPRVWSTTPDMFVHPNEAMLIGYWQGDGSSSSTRARFTDGRLGSHKTVVELLSWCGFRSETFKRPDANAWVTRVKSVKRDGFIDFLNDYGIFNQKTGEERVPDSIARSSDETVLSYLRGLYDCEGCVYVSDKSPPRINLGMKSMDFLREIQLLWLRFGVHARLSVTPYSTHGGSGGTLTISGVEQLQSAADLLYPLPSKSNELDQLALHCMERSPNTNVDLMPFKSRWLGAWMTENGIVRQSGSKWWNLTSCSATRHLSYGMWTRWVHEHRDHDAVLELASKFPDEIIYHRVKSVRQVEEAIEVGDMCVQEDHRFVCAGMSVHNSIGWGKSYTASFGLMYAMYRLTCLRAPQETFGIAGDSKILFALLSMTREHCKETLYNETLKPKLEASPYFRDIGTKLRTYDAQIIPGINLVLDSTKGGNVIGKNVFGGIIDEVNFGSSTRRVNEKQTLNSKKAQPTQVQKVYESIIRRMKSRFMRQGALPGVLFVVSSSNTEDDFTNQRIAESLDDPNVYVMSYPEWGTKPASKYSGEKFRVFFGGSSMSSTILEGNEEPPPHDDDEHAKVIEIPIEFYADFDSDIEGAIRDIAGISVPRIMPYISNWKAIERIRSRRQDELPPTKKPIWFSGDPTPFLWNRLCVQRQEMDGPVLVDRYFPIRNPDAPRHVHIDTSLRQDLLGIAMGHVDKMVQVTMRDKDTGDLYTEAKPNIWYDVLLAIKAPPEGEIQFSYIRRLIYELQAHGFNITYLSADSYQSSDSLQQFRQRGIKAEVYSLDRTMEGYNILKEAIYQDRVHAYDYDHLIEELKYLQVDNVKRKVDHLPDRSKDVSDAAAGVARSLTELEVSVGMPYIPNDSDSSSSSHPLDQWNDISNPGSPSPRRRAGPGYSELPPWLSGG